MSEELNTAGISDEETVLCGASAYSRLFYLNENFDSLPDEIKKELKILCVTHTAEVGGNIMLIFDEDGNLYFRTDANESDFSYDEIGSGLKIHALETEKRDLLEELETYYKVFFLGETGEEGKGED